MTPCCQKTRRRPRVSRRVAQVRLADGQLTFDGGAPLLRQADDRHFSLTDLTGAVAKILGIRTEVPVARAT